MRLYYLPQACSFAARITVHELALDCEFVEATSEVRASSHFLQLAPLSKVPVLVTDGGEVITELTAVLSYLCALREGALLPRDPMAIARVYECISLFTTEMHRLFIQCHQPHRILPDEHLHARLKEEARHKLTTLLRIADTRLGAGPYVAGAEFSIADAMLTVVAAWAIELKFPIAELSNIQAWVPRILARPSVQKAFSEEGITARA
jgi:glutathione S-transferase